MDWRKASQVATVVAGIPIAAGIVGFAYDNVAKVDEVKRDLCIAEYRSELNRLELEIAHFYSSYINIKVNQARSASSDGPIGPEFGAPNRTVEESKKRADKFYETVQKLRKEASDMAERIRKAERIGKNCEEIMEGFTTALKGN